MLLEAQPLKEIYQKGNININILSNNKAHSSLIIWGISLLEKQWFPTNIRINIFFSFLYSIKHYLNYFVKIIRYNLSVYLLIFHEI